MGWGFCGGLGRGVPRRQRLCTWDRQEQGTSRHVRQTSEQACRSCGVCVHRGSDVRDLSIRVLASRTQARVQTDTCSASSRRVLGRRSAVQPPDSCRLWGVCICCQWMGNFRCTIGRRLSGSAPAAARRTCTWNRGHATCWRMVVWRVPDPVNRCHDPYVLLCDRSSHLQDSSIRDCDPGGRVFTVRSGRFVGRLG